jgi:glyoxylase-like metal-dependent hydrolase (beta-lactamase superfamily II)
VSEGSFPYPPSLFFANVSQQRLGEELRAHGLRTDEITGTYTCLLVNLEKAGARPSAIDTVILTHAHPDHIGGAVDAEGEPAFPNARYLMLKDEWEFWTSEEPDLCSMQLPEELKTGLILGTARRCLPPIRKQVELVEKESEVIPGIHLLPAPGYTPGHAAVAVSSGRDSALHIADAVLHPILMEQPAWRTAFDLEQDHAAETRRRLLDRAAADKTKVMAFRFPFPAVGRVVAGHAGGWQWKPAS